MAFILTHYPEWNFTPEEISKICELGEGHCVEEIVYITKNSFILLWHEYIHFIIGLVFKEKGLFLDRLNDHLWIFLS
jgi:hypothetical protein